MKVLSILASLMLAGTGPTDILDTAQPHPHGQFVISHVPGDELQQHVLGKCEYGDGSKCLFMNLDRVNHPVGLKFRIDASNVNLSGAVAEAEYVAWIQRNNNACRYAENDESLRRLGKAPLTTSRVRSSTTAAGVVFDAHRIEMSSTQITDLTGGKPLDIAQWQICVGIDPKHGTLIEGDKHPIGSLPFFIGTRKPDAPELAGVQGRHEKIIATVTLPEALRDRIAAIGLRAIPTKLATMAPVDDDDSNDDPNRLPPKPVYACPGWSDYHGLVISTGFDQEIKVRDEKYLQLVDANDGKMHIPIDLKTDPKESYVVCAYARDRVNNVSDLSASAIGQSYRASDTFVAIPPGLRMQMGHGCADIGMTPLSVAAAACAAAVARLRRRWRKTRH